MKNKLLKVNEIFYSLQGEGKRVGEASIFIRLSNCNLNCWFCDTEFLSGENMSLNQIKTAIKGYDSKWIVWTGGEPTLQLTDEIMQYFHNLGYKNAIESNGLKKMPEYISHRVISPKQNFSKVIKNNATCDEVRLPFDRKTEVPKIVDLPLAKDYYLSPIFLGKQKERFSLSDDNLKSCIEFIKKNPVWKLSLQNHKIWKVQ